MTDTDIERMAREAEVWAVTGEYIPQSREFNQRLARFAALAREANPEVRVYLFEGWPSRTTNASILPNEFISCAPAKGSPRRRKPSPPQREIPAPWRGHLGAVCWRRPVRKS